MIVVDCCTETSLECKTDFKSVWLISRRIYRGNVNLILLRHCPSNFFWKWTIWNINSQYRKYWYTVFAFRHCKNLVSSSMNPSWTLIQFCFLNWSLWSNKKLSSKKMPITTNLCRKTLKTMSHFTLDRGQIIQIASTWRTWGPWTSSTWWAALVTAYLWWVSLQLS